MTQDELQRTLVTNGLTCRVRGREVVVETCVFCGNAKWNLELNAEKGVFKCWVCKEGGRLDRFLKTVTGERHHIPVALGDREKAKPVGAPQPAGFLTVPVEMVYPASKYLARRGLTPDVIRDFGLAVCAEHGHRLEGRLVIPARDFWTNAIVGWVGRTFTGAHPKYLSTLPRSAVTGWRVAGRRTPCVVVEGHLDGIAVRRAGYSAAVLGGTGATDVAEWAARLWAETPVLVMLDGDASETARRLYWGIVAVRGQDQTRLVELGVGQDPADLGPAGVADLVARVLGTSLGAGPQLTSGER